MVHLKAAACARRGDTGELCSRDEGKSTAIEKACHGHMRSSSWSLLTGYGGTTTGAVDVSKGSGAAVGQRIFRCQPA